MKENGFTLVELIVALSIVIIGLTIGAPSFSSLSASSKLDANARDLVTVLSQARSEAVTRNVQVSVIPGTSGQWSSDWSLITDDNGNGIKDGSDELIGVRQFKSGVTFVNSDNMYSDFAGYLPNGFGIGSGGDGGGVIQICPIGSATVSRLVTISPTGKPEIAAGGTCA